jgi:cell division septation protein DedD
LTELSFQVQTQSTGEGLRIVRVGPFQDRAAAEEAARAIAEATNLSPLVMRN